MRNLFEEWKKYDISYFAITIAIIAFTIVILLISFLATSLIYYVFTIVMSNFFSIIIPFTWHYAIGVWLITILIRFLFGNSNNRN